MNGTTTRIENLNKHCDLLEADLKKSKAEIFELESEKLFKELGVKEGSIVRTCRGVYLLTSINYYSRHNHNVIRMRGREQNHRAKDGFNNQSFPMSNIRLSDLEFLDFEIIKY